MAGAVKIVVSSSSGKDAAVAGLLTATNSAFDRVAMHGVRRAVLDAQARAAGLPLHVGRSSR